MRLHWCWSSTSITSTNIVLIAASVTGTIFNTSEGKIDFYQHEDVLTVTKGNIPKP